MKKQNTLYLAQAAVIAAVYSVLTLVLAPFSFGPIQCRISEILTVLPAFIPAAVPGVTLGCFISNLLGGGVIPDVIFGTLATCIGAVGTAFFTRKLAGPDKDIRFRLAAVLPPILSNTLIIPFVLRYAYGCEDAVWFLMLTVGTGEIVSIGILGNLFISLIRRNKLLNAVDAAAAKPDRA